MNRWLAIPALCCFLSFAGLMVVLHRAAGRERSPQPMVSDGDLSGASVANEEQLLTALAEEYQRPWREWENSPRRLYSRAAPRPIPQMLVETKIAPNAELRTDQLLFGTVNVRMGTQSETIPYVIDRTAKEVRLFANGQWLTGAEWLKTAPGASWKR